MSRLLLTFFALQMAWVSALPNPEKIRELERKLPLATDTVRVNILNKLSGLYVSTNLKYADSLADAAFSLLKTMDYQAGSIRNFNHLSYIKSSLGQFEIGLDFSDEAISQSTLLGDKNLLAESYDYRFMLLFQQGNNAEAQKYAQLCNDKAQEAENIRLMAKSYDNLGIIHGIKGQHTEAIELFLKSLEAYEKLGNDANISVALMHLGHTFELAGNYNKALEYLKRSLEINKKTGNKFNEGWGLVNIGVVYSRMNQLDTALAYYEASLIIAEEIKNHRYKLT